MVAQMACSLCSSVEMSSESVIQERNFARFTTANLARSKRTWAVRHVFRFPESVRSGDDYFAALSSFVRLSARVRSKPVENMPHQSRGRQGTGACIWFDWYNLVPRQ